jgi:hypothetical protein
MVMSKCRGINTGQFFDSKSGKTLRVDCITFIIETLVYYITFSYKNDKGITVSEKIDRKSFRNSVIQEI